VTQKTRVALVDDHPLFRQGLRALLEGEADLEVVGEAADARRAYELAESRHPEVIIVDVSLPGIDGVGATRELTRRLPHCRVLILSMHSEPSLVQQSLQAGALGYAVKTEPPQEVLAAVRATARGQRYLAPSLSVDEAQADGSADPIASLSQRERDVFQLLVRGFSNQRASKELCISIKTVETHRTHIHQKLGVHSVAELIRFAARHHLLDL
jgi:two-component system response regulator NreC